MSMKYLSVTGLRYVAADGSAIACTVEFEGIGPVPFTAASGDAEDHGREIFARATAGEFGPVAAFSPPIATADNVRGEARRRIIASVPEWKQINMGAREGELLRIQLGKMPSGEGARALTTEEQAEEQAIQHVWEWVKTVRAASNVMEPNPPADYRDDRHWPAPL
jgi:hypothetical protein